MAFKVFALFVLVACPMVMAQYGHQEEHYEHEPHYEFEYAVHDDHTKDIHSHKESRKGDLTQGEYSLVEADGTIRTVKYHVDGKSGFIAEVSHDGHAVHAAPAIVAKPIVVAKPLLAVAKPVLAAYKPLAFHHAAPAAYHHGAAPAATSFVSTGHYSHDVHHY